MGGRRVLAVDVGSGTQDILYHEQGKDPAASFKMILPSETQLVAGRIERAGARGKPVFLRGNLMGGGPCVGALRKHLLRGLAVYATPKAALTINDDLDKVAAMGVRIVEEEPGGVVSVLTRDVWPQKLKRILELAGLEMPGEFAVAVLDHGFSPAQSNRRSRFRMWERFVARGAELAEMAFTEIPAELTRMKAVQEDLPGALLMDTAAAAFLGALQDPVVREKAERGVTVLNLGNQHATAGLIVDQRLLGVMEHHTGKLDAPRLDDLINRFRSGLLCGDEVFENGGHGCTILGEVGEGRFEFVAVTGPHRSLARDLGFYQAAPYGDMMLVGCFGLVSAAGLL